MLTEIKLTNFKCFKEETSIPLSQFNFFTGVNGAGKSTALQALLLMRQSIEHNPYTTELILNGSCVNLGSFDDDVRNRDIPKDNPIFIEFFIRNITDIGLFSGSIYYQLNPRNDNMSLNISEIIINQNSFEPFLTVPKKIHLYCGINNLYIINDDSAPHEGVRLVKLSPCYFNKEKKHSTIVSSILEDKNNKPLLNDNSINSISKNSSMLGKSSLNNFLIFNEETNQDNLGFEKIHFISADRIGPQEFYFKSNLSDFLNVGTKGEFAVNLLDKMKEKLVNEELCLWEDEPRTLQIQTRFWLSRILNADIKLKITPLRVNILELLINDFKPSNVGFGYSSILPIIVTGLIAKPGEKIIIENPEIHLHPKAQSALIEFLIKVANTGVQIFIESHSDHVLNALRIATKNKLIKPEDVNILFFGLENGNSKIIKPTLDENGRIDQWPEDFFDETAKSLASLAAGQRPRIKAPKAES